MGSFNLTNQPGMTHMGCHRVWQPAMTYMEYCWGHIWELQHLAIHAGPGLLHQIGLLMDAGSRAATQQSDAESFPIRVTTTTTITFWRCASGYGVFGISYIRGFYMMKQGHIC